MFVDFELIVSLVNCALGFLLQILLSFGEAAYVLNFYILAGLVNVTCSHKHPHRTLITRHTKKHRRDQPTKVKTLQKCRGDQPNWAR